MLPSHYHNVQVHKPLNWHEYTVQKKTFHTEIHYWHTEQDFENE